MLGLTKVIAGVCAAAVIAGGVLAGCGKSQGDATLPRVSCGSAATHVLDDGTQLLSASPGALPCFVAAAKNCKAASMKVTAMGVDAGTDYVFVIKTGTEPCQVAEQSQFYIVTGDIHRDPVTSTRCQIAAVTVHGVTLSCRGELLLIPTKVGAGSF